MDIKKFEEAKKAFIALGKVLPPNASVETVMSGNSQFKDALKAAHRGYDGIDGDENLLWKKVPDSRDLMGDIVGILEATEKKYREDKSAESREECNNHLKTAKCMLADLIRRLNGIS